MTSGLRVMNEAAYAADACVGASVSSLERRRAAAYHHRLRLLYEIAFIPCQASENVNGASMPQFLLTAKKDDTSSSPLFPPGCPGPCPVRQEVSASSPVAAAISKHWLSGTKYEIVGRNP